MSEPALTMDRLYQEICASIRATDDISFKLMGFVPLVSGATLLTFFLREPIRPEQAPLVAALALFAALVTLGLFRWELRNIQTCSWLRRRAEAVERVLAQATGAPPQPRAPLGVGKTEAEKAIYSVTVMAWLLLPFALVEGARLRELLPAYALMAVPVAAATLWSALGSVHVPPAPRVSER